GPVGVVQEHRVARGVVLEREEIGRGREYRGVVAVDVEEEVDWHRVRLNGDGSTGPQRHDGGVGADGSAPVVVNRRDGRDSAPRGKDPQIAQPRDVRRREVEGHGAGDGRNAAY